MNNHDGAQWPTTNASYDPLNPMTEDDFANFLDLDNIDFDFPLNHQIDYDTSAQANTHVAPDTSSAPPYNDFDRYETCPPTLMSQYTNGHIHDTSIGVDHIDYAAYEQEGVARQWQSQNSTYPHMSVPPTPNSSGMYTSSYVQRMENQSRPMDRQHGFNELTPLTSPQFVNSAASNAMPGYPMHDSQILSPLSSPAMFAQPGSNGGSASVQSLTAESSANGSPIDQDQDGNSHDSSERPRKTRRKQSSSSLSNPPAASTRKRKAAAAAKTSSRSSLRGMSLDEKAGSVANQPASADLMGSYPSSTSPQPGLAMRPPPKPTSVKNTPSIDPQLRSSSSNGQPPATPASLMRLSSKQQSASASLNPSPAGLEPPSPATDSLGLGMEELHLPEAAGPPIETTFGSATPRILANAPSSTRATPALLPRIPNSGPSTMASPSVAPPTNTSKNPNGRGGSRKRNSTSSALVSPAIRPRIGESPNIRPIVSNDPSQANASQTKINDETHALLLASKSNYQNLLEGNTLPGVNYPSELSHNLTSKRTSHKLAEQGRRNRINTALQEMQALLPGSPTLEGMSMSPSSGDGPETNGNTEKTPTTPSLQGANSKAATVELAIEHIRSLNARLAEKDGENDRLRLELEETKRRFINGNAADSNRAKEAAKGKAVSPKAREAAKAGKATK